MCVSVCVYRAVKEHRERESGVSKVFSFCLNGGVHVYVQQHLKHRGMGSETKDGG